MKALKSFVISTSLFVFCSSSLSAASDADILLQSVVDENLPSEGGSTQGTGVSKQTRDPFLLQFLYAWRAQGSLPYDVNRWVQLLLTEEFRAASHLWSVVKGKLPETFEQAARTAHVYTLWKLDLSQIFFSEWLELNRRQDFKSTPLLFSLNDQLKSQFSQRMISEGWQVSSHMEKLLDQLSTLEDPLLLSVGAFTKLRKGEQALRYLERLPETHPLAIPLAKTVVLAETRKGNLAGAAKIIKKFLEPSIHAQKKEQELVRHYLQLARLLYQAGSLDAAETYYSRIPSGVPEFYEAREELAWVWLRKGDRQKLRGEVKTLSSPVFESLFAPEMVVVRAISNLKLCYYSDVEKDFRDFHRLYLPRARQIQQALSVQDPPEPERLDDFAQAALSAIQKRENEAKLIESLSQESIAAVLPAVGPQSHWESYRKEVLSSLEELKKVKSEELRRLWKAQQLALTEAIRKMRFVKVELLTQIKTSALQAQLETTEEDRINVSQASALKGEEGKQIFPFDGVVWPDEFFRLRGLSKGKCLNRGGR